MSPNYYCDSNSKLCFHLLLFSFFRFLFVCDFLFKIEGLLPTLNLNSVQIRSRKGNIDPNFFFKFNLKLCIWLFVRIWIRIIRQALRSNSSLNSEVISRSKHYAQLGNTLKIIFGISCFDNAYFERFHRPMF